MNPSRLAELNHQRALVEQQLAWLDREIAQETRGATTPAVSHQPPPENVAQSKVALAPELEALHPDPTSAAVETRRGCLIALVIVALITVAALVAIYFLRYSDRPILFMTKDAASSKSTTGPGARDK